MSRPRDPTDPRSDSGPRWQLRVLDGPARGTTCGVGARLGIGRSTSADLQLVEHEVSRQHARIIEDERGRHVLVDLESSNGTFVGGRAIQRHVLRAHDVITVAGVELVYEPVPAATAPLAETPVDVHALRRGTEHPVVVARTHAPTAPVAAAVPAGALLDRDGRALVFERPDGREYEGNLVDDVSEYRMLRAQHLRGGFSDPSMRDAFARLGARLAQPRSSDPRLARRAFCRFGCWLPADVRLPSGDVLPCHVRDLGVDGAQLVTESHELGAEVLVWLAIDVVDSGRPRSIVLAARVAWTDGEFAGLAFASAPRPVDGRYAERPDRRDDVEDRRADDPGRA